MAKIGQLSTRKFDKNCQNQGKQSKHPEIQGLPLSLKLACGAFVMLTTNLNVCTGLVNGATGVVDTIYIDESDRIIGCLVYFKDFKGQQILEFPAKHVPIFDVTKQEYGTRRKMIPLKLSWTMTIHKSQGLTLDEISVHLGKKEYTPGQTFVAISRVKNLASINIHDLTKTRIRPLMHDTPVCDKWPTLLENLEEIGRLRQLL